MSRSAAVLAAAALAAACATSVEPMPSDFGPEAYQISCSEMTTCERKAEQLCPAGYEKLNPDILTRMVAGFTIPWSAIARGAGNALTGRYPDGDRVLFMRCEGEPPHEPPAAPVAEDAPL